MPILQGSPVSEDASPFSFDTLTTIEKDHGRIEFRKYDICYEASPLEERYNWPNLVAFGRVTSTRETAKGTTTATRYLISSGTLAVESFAGAVRGHSFIENSLHWGMDMAFREDNQEHE